MVHLTFSPNHFVDDASITLNDFHHFGRYILLHIVRYRDTMIAVTAETYGSLYSLQQTIGIDAGNDKTTLIEGLWPLSTRADTHSWERMAYTGKETAFLWESSTVAHYGKSIHLQTIIVVET